MPDWTKPMQQTYEFYKVDPVTWGNISKLTLVTGCSIDRDIGAETLGSASIDTTETISEQYIRTFLVTNQNGIEERFPLGTHLVQTPSINFDGKIFNSSLECYTPLLELKDIKPPLGYTIVKGENIMDAAYRIIRDVCRVPVVPSISKETLFSDFVADPNDSWLSFIISLISMAKFHLEVNENGNILFSPDVKLEELQPVWTFTDDNSSILLPSVSLNRDLYGIPNTVEVIYSNGGKFLTATVVNDDPNSPVSTVARGRVVFHRVVNPSIPGYIDQDSLNDYAKNLLKQLSSLEYTVTYSHGYCPVRIGDCVRLNYKSAGLDDIKAVVTSQTIQCKTGCEVQETAVFTNKLWR